MSGQSPDDPIVVRLDLHASIQSHLMMRQIGLIIDKISHAREVYDTLNGEDHSENCMLCADEIDTQSTSLAMLFFTVHQMYWPGILRKPGSISINMPPVEKWVDQECRVCTADVAAGMYEADHTKSLGTLDIDEDVVCMPRCGHVMHLQCCLLHMRCNLDLFGIPTCAVCNLEWFVTEAPSRSISGQPHL